MTLDSSHNILMLSASRIRKQAFMDAPPIGPGEVVGGAPERADASLIFIGRIRTPRFND